MMKNKSTTSRYRGPMPIRERDQRWALLSCPSSWPMNVSVYDTFDEAAAAKKHLDAFACGGRCRRDHAICVVSEAVVKKLATMNEESRSKYLYAITRYQRNEARNAA
jgi:hypothetical protein